VAGANTLFFVLAIVWATDIAPYVVGRSIGGPRLAPRWSRERPGRADRWRDLPRLYRLAAAWVSELGRAAAVLVSTHLRLLNSSGSCGSVAKRRDRRERTRAALFRDMVDFSIGSMVFLQLIPGGGIADGARRPRFLGWRDRKIVPNGGFLAASGDDPGLDRSVGCNTIDLVLRPARERFSQVEALTRHRQRELLA